MGYYSSPFLFWERHGDLCAPDQVMESFISMDPSIERWRSLNGNWIRGFRLQRQDWNLKKCPQGGFFWWDEFGSWQGVIVGHQPKQCIDIREIPQNYHRCVMLDFIPPKWAPFNDPWSKQFKWNLHFFCWTSQLDFFWENVWGKAGLIISPRCPGCQNMEILTNP